MSYRRRLSSYDHYKRYRNRSSKPNSELCRACELGQKTKVVELLNQGPDPNSEEAESDWDDPTPLHYACEHGWLDIVEKLVEEYKYDVNAQRRYRGPRSRRRLWKPETPLHIACRLGHSEIAKLLIKKYKCNPNVKGWNGMTPLLFAFHNEKFELAKILINMNVCDLNVEDSNQNTPLHYACDCNRTDLIEELITHGASTNVTDRYGNTLIHYCVQRNVQVQTISSLLNVHNFDLNIKNKNGATPLLLLAKSNSLKRVATLMSLLVIYGANPNTTDNDGNTPLHVACKAGSLESVKHFLNLDCYPNAKNNSGLTPLQVISPKKSDIIQELITHGANPNVTDNKSSTLLHIACERGIYESVNCLLNAADCDPNVKNKFGLTPLQVTSLRYTYIIRALITHGANPNVTDSDGSTLLHKVCKKGLRHVQLVKLLLDTACGTKVDIKNKSGLTPLQVTPPWVSGIIEELLKHGANPNVTDSDGNTLLHKICQTESAFTVETLFNYSLYYCDPNAKNKAGLTPLQMSSDTIVIRELIRHGANVDNIYKTHGRSLKQPLVPPVKVFIVGNPSAGKSTLTAALKKESSFLRRTFTTSKKVTGVDTKTAGVVPHDFKSKEYGYATFYDFAGQREFYGSHAALLQNVILSSPPVFIIVVDLRESEEKIKQTIQYWLIFLDNQCTSVSGKPHIIIVGSHADILKIRGENPILKTNYSKTNMDNFVFAGFIAMDCQYPESNGMDELRQCLRRSCKVLRTRETISFNAHCFHVYLVDKFKDSVAVTVEQMQAQITTESPQDGDVMDFIPHTLHNLCKICDELNDRGHVLFLKDPCKIEQSWIVIDKTSLLTQVSGSIFAPENFKQHKVITQCTCSTGIVPLSSIEKSFPDHKPDMLVKFLSCLEFCHEISDPEILHCITSEHTTCVVSGTDHNHKGRERYFLFPALISLIVPLNVWDDKPEYTHHCGWILQCSNNRLEEFFTSRFLQVLLLRTVFSFSLSEAGDSIKSNPAIKRNCSLWKNGIFWGSTYGVETLVEVFSDNKAVVVLMRCQNSERSVTELIQLRSQIICKVLKAAEEFCSRIEMVESFIDPFETKRYPLNPATQLKLFSITNTSQAVLNTGMPVNIVSPTGAIPLEGLLQYEPYAGLGENILLEIFENQNNNTEKVPDSLLSRIALAKAKDRNPILFIKLFNPKYEDTQTVTKHDILSALKTWIAGCAGTYKSLREKLDEFSIFAGRDTLLQTHFTGSQQRSKQQQNEEDASNDTDIIDTVLFKGEKPILEQLTDLKFRSSGETVTVVESIASKWEDLALALGIRTIVIDILRRNFRDDCEGAATEVLTKWLNGESDLDKPITWDTLIQCLNEAGKVVLAENLTETLKD